MSATQTTNDERLTAAVHALAEAEKVVTEVLGDESSAVAVKVRSAIREVAELGKLHMCDVTWCESRYPDHHEHCFDQTITSNSGIEHIEIGAGVDMHGDYDDEIGFRAWFREGETYDSVTVNLTVNQARQVIAAIELAISRRAELRGVAR